MKLRYRIAKIAVGGLAILETLHIAAIGLATYMIETRLPARLEEMRNANLAAICAQYPEGLCVAPIYQFDMHPCDTKDGKKVFACYKPTSVHLDKRFYADYRLPEGRAYRWLVGLYGAWATRI